MDPENCWWRPINHHIGHTRAQTSSTNNSQCGKIKSRNGVHKRPFQRHPPPVPRRCPVSRLPRKPPRSVVEEPHCHSLFVTCSLLPATCRRPLQPSDLEEEKTGRTKGEDILLMGLSISRGKPQSTPSPS